MEGQLDHACASADNARRSIAPCRRTPRPLRAAWPARHRALMRPRRPPRLHVSAALALLTLAGCTQAAVSGDHINLQQAERIYTDVQEVRQLNFKAEVPLVLMDQDHANRVLDREVGGGVSAGGLVIGCA